MITVNGAVCKNKPIVTVCKEQSYDGNLSKFGPVALRHQTVIEVVGELGDFSFERANSFQLLVPVFEHLFGNIKGSQHSNCQRWLLRDLFVNPVEHRVDVRGDLFRKVFVFSTEWVVRAEDLDFDALAGHTVCRNYVRKLVRRHVNQIALTVVPFQRERLQARIDLRYQLFNLCLQLFLLLS